MSFKVFILDFDGVITSLNINWDEVKRKASKIAGFDIPSLTKFFENNFSTKLFWKVSKLVEKYEIMAVKIAKPYPDVKTSLEILSRSGKVIFLATMQATCPVTFFLEKHGLMNYFYEILTRDMFGSKRKQLNYILNKVDIPPRTIVLIDDSRYNYKICRKLKLACILLKQRNNYTLYKVITDLLT